MRLPCGLARAFYESECQGRTPCALSRWRVSPGHSAPNFPGCARLDWPIAMAASSMTSFVATSCSLCLLPVPLWTIASAGGSPESEPWFYLRLSGYRRPDAFSGPAGGPVVRRESQPTRAGRNAQEETASRFPVPVSGSAHEESWTPVDSPETRGCYRVACIDVVNRAGSYRSPVFHRWSVIAANFRLNVTRASSARIPRVSIPR